MGGWCITDRSGWLLEHLTELKMSSYCPQGSGTLRQQLFMIHCIAWYCMVAGYLIILHGIAWYCMVLHGIAWYCMVLLGIALSCIVLHYNALYCNILHYLEQSFTILHSLARVYIGYTCSQQMSPVIAFDIAVVAQKVQVSVI